MSQLPRSNVVKFPTLCVLMFRSGSVKSPRDQFKSLSLARSVVSNTGRSVRLLKIPENSAALCRMNSATMFLS